MDDDLEAADAVAFVLAHLRGDEQLIGELLAMHEVRNLFAAVTGLLVRLLAEAGAGEAALERSLTGWQEQRRAKLGLPSRRARGVPAGGCRSCWQAWPG